MYHTTLYFRVCAIDGEILCYCATRSRAETLAETLNGEIEEYHHGHGWTVA